MRPGSSESSNQGRGVEFWAPDQCNQHRTMVIQAPEQCRRIAGGGSRPVNDNHGLSSETRLIYSHALYGTHAHTETTTLVWRRTWIADPCPEWGVCK